MIEIIGGEKYMVVDDEDYLDMDPEYRDCLECREDCTIICESSFDEIRILRDFFYSVSNIIYATEQQLRRLDEDKDKTVILALLKFLKKLIDSKFEYYEDSLETFYTKVENDLGDYLKLLGYDKFKDLDFKKKEGK